MKQTYSNAIAQAKAAIESLKAEKTKAMPTFLAVYGPYRAAIMTARQRGVLPQQIVLELEKHGVRTPAMASMRERGVTYHGPIWGACIMIGRLCKHKG